MLSDVRFVPKADIAHCPITSSAADVRFGSNPIIDGFSTTCVASKTTGAFDLANLSAMFGLGYLNLRRSWLLRSKNSALLVLRAIDKRN